MFAHFKLDSCYHHSCYVVVRRYIVAMLGTSAMLGGLHAYNNITKQFIKFILFDNIIIIL